MDRSAALRPLDETADDVRRLDEYRNHEELAETLLRVADAVERALRIRLRSDTGAPDPERLTALAPDRLSLDEVVKSLRTRDLISLETAGTVHQFGAAADRAREGVAKAADADLARDVVERLRRELTTPAPPASVGDGVDGDDGDDGDDGLSPEPDASARVGRWMAWLAAGIAAVIVVGAVWVGVLGGSQDYDEAVTAFRAGRLDSAASRFEQLRERRDLDVSVRLYLGRIYRRLDRPAEAAEVLREAVAIDGQDGGVRRELGHLFMDLEQPRAAVGQYERALEYEPDSPLNWAALIGALRSLEDPRAERLLRDAPPEVQAVLGGG